MSELSDLIKMLRNKKESGSDYIGIVSRVDGDTAYVQMAGADIMDTPVAMTVDCKPGDRVRVRVNSGRAWITGNDTAPPTNDTRNIQKLNNAANSNSQRLNNIQKTVDETAGIAANTNQYFWRTEKGTDTGVHITEKPRSEFIKDPEHGGSNLLARSNGIAVRDGLKELAQFRGDGMDFYDQHGGNVVNIDTNAVSYAPYLYESYKNEDLAPSVPWQIEVTSPYFSDFTTNGSLGLQVNGVMEWVSFDFSSDYAGTVESYYATVQIAYSASNKTFTFTSSAQIYLYVNIHWQSNIMASSFAFGLRSGSKGAFSATVGEGLMAEHDNQIAVGRFNKNKQDNIFEVGIGEEDDARINALEVSKDGYVTPFRGCNLVQSLYTEQLTQTYLSSASITYCVMGKMLFFSLTFIPKQNITSAVGNISIPSTIKNFESAISYPVTDGGASSTHTTSRVAWCIPYTKQFRIVGAYSTGVEYTFGGVAMLIP